MADLWHGSTKYPCGWLRPKVWWGYFNDGEIGDLQRLFFKELQAQGFKRTPWQLVFPGQTAGLIKPIKNQPSGINENHVRFYDDGTIESELEVSRSEMMHWAGPRQSGIDALNALIEGATSIECTKTRDCIKELFGTKPYSASCVRKNGA